ncbi:MAG: T9SS type A sorting domain-containing protein [Lewinellaceae bacterium]|nr:T9SS type A sorting domain-containing protein [Lewinellaceae bacterium]
MGQTSILLGKILMRNWISLIVILFPFLVNAQVSVTFLHTNASCFGNCDGSATAVGIGGTFPYTFAWSTGSTGASLNNLCAGTYTVTVTDAAQNTGTGSVTIVQPNELTVTVETENQICGVAPDGAAFASVTGGTAPFTYAWSNSASGSTITGLAEGPYTVTVTDFNGCTAVDVDSVFFWNEGIWLMCVPDANITCFGANDGVAHVNPMSGTAPYTFNWNTGATTENISGVGPGTYSVTVTDVNGCLNSCTLTLTEPPVLTAAVDSTAALCGQAGSASVTPAGGAPGYTILWSTGESTATINVPAGTFTVTVTDLNSCTVVSELSVPGDTVALEVTTNIIKNALCLLGGSAEASASGGSGDYKYSWNNGDSTALITNQPAGIYTVTVTDQSTGCTGTATAEIMTLTSDLGIEATMTMQAGCTVGGSAMATASGGILPYQEIVWDSLFQGLNISNLSVGQHVVIVTDSAGCIATDTIQITKSDDPTVVASQDTMVTCASNGSAVAAASGGVVPYVYAWSSGAQTTKAPNLPAGTYTVTATDNVGCTATATVTLEEPEDPSVTVINVVNASCTTPGSATASPSDGTAPYTYLWDNGETTQTAINLGPGMHTVTVTDAGGCSTISDDISIMQPDAPTVMTQMLTKANCNGGAGGSALATASGGAGGYQYAWSSGGISDTETGLSAGMYTVTVTDALDCTATATVTIVEKDPPTVALNVLAAATCAMDGEVEATPADGTPPYSFLWSGGQTSAVISSLAAGTYTVTVTDDATCTAVDSVSLPLPPSPMVDITSSTDSDCAVPGTATAETTGGTPQYTYAWDNGETTATAVNLSPGLHTVTVSDNNMCTDTDTVTINVIGSGGVNVGDFVWYEYNNNPDGFQHPIETGVDSVSVMLIQAGPDGQFNTPDDIVVDSTLTDTLGKYLFTCVPPGEYIIMFGNIPAGYEFTRKDNVNNDCKDSDANKQGKTDPFTVQTGQTDNLCVDAGILWICDNVVNPGMICCNQTICEGGTPALLYESVAPSGGSGDLEYLWMQLVQYGSAPPTWVAIPGATDIDYQPGALSETAYFMRCVRREDCFEFKESNIITITVLPAGSPSCPQFFSDFNVSAMSTATVQVSWKTQPELSRYLYTVERSMDKTNWTVVEEIMGHEDATGLNAYEVMDHAPANGMNYYRVKRRSNSGAEALTDIRQIEIFMTKKEAMAVYPNPVAQTLYIRNLMAYDTDVRIDMFTTRGELLISLKVAAGTMQNFEVPMADLPQGLYIARIRFDDGETKTMKISKM